MNIKDKDYSYWRDNQQELRDCITTIMLRKKMGIETISRDIGISVLTLTTFLIKRQNKRWDSLCKILDYCIKNEIISEQ